MSVFQEFPSKGDWKRISETSLFEELYPLLDELDKKIRPTDDRGDIFEYIELQGWLYHLRQRLNDAKYSYVLMMFYYEQGIPDEQWIAESNDGWRYFPNFDDIHFIIKEWFDFYSDTTYYKIFTTWDTFGHFLNIKHRLGIKQNDVHFTRVIKRLSKTGNNLYIKMQSILNSPEFKKANSIRNNITHNYLPHKPGLVGNRITDDKNVPGIVVSLEINKYIISTDIVKNIDETLKLLKQSVEYLLV